MPELSAVIGATLRLNGDPAASRKMEIMGPQPVISVGANTPPGSPATNDRHLTGPAPTGAWSGHANEWTRWLSTAAWEFAAPQQGWSFYCTADKKTYQWNGTGFAALEPPTAALSSFSLLTPAADRLPYYTGASTASLTVLTAAGRALLDDADATAQRATLGLVIGTDVQAQDAQLAAIAGLNPSADQVAYFTGTTTASLMTVTSFMRTVLDDTDATSVRTTLGLAIGTNVQAWDAELAALAALTSAADRLPYFTGAGTAGLATFSAFARTLVDDADAATMRSTLGLATGTDVQAYDIELAAIASLTSAADRVPMFTGLGTATLITVTAAARGLLDDVDAATQRATLGLTIGTDVQAQDAQLAAIAGLNPGADQVPYFTALTTASLMTVTAAARTLLDDTTTSAMRTTLGLVIGTDVQPQDAELTAIAGLTSAADSVPMFTGLGTASLITVTAAARSVLDDTSTSAMRTTLGVAIGSDVQAFDAQLAAIAGLAPSADQVPYFTALTTASLMTITSFARGLLDDADAATMRSTLGLVIGTNVQAYDAELAALAGLTSAADRLPYFTGAGTAGLATFSAFARTLVDDVDAATMRSTLGLVIGTNVQAQNTTLSAVASLAGTAGTFPIFTGAGTAVESTITVFGASLLDDASASSARTTLGVAIGTNVQAWDSTLDILATLAHTTNTFPYFDSTTTVANAAITAAGLALIDDASVAAQRATLGIAQTLKTSGSAVFGTINTGETASDIGSTGVAANDAVVATPRTALPAGVVIKHAHVSGANVRITLYNYSGNTSTVGTVTFDIALIRT